MQEHWSGLPFPSPGDLPDPGIETASPAQGYHIKWLKQTVTEQNRLLALVATVKQAEIETLLPSPSTTITDACRKLVQNTVMRLKVVTQNLKVYKLSSEKCLSDDNL